MKPRAEDFEVAWARDARGEGPSTHHPAMAGLVAVARGLGSLQQAVQTPSLDGAWARLSAELDGQVVPARGRLGPVRPPRTRRMPRRRLVLQLAAAAVAVFAVLATVSLRARWRTISV